MQSRLGSNREIRKLPEYLWEGELVTHLVSGVYGPGLGLVVLTNRRLLFVKNGWLSKLTESFPLDKISSVQWSEGVISGKLIVFSSGNKAEISQVPRPDGKKIADTLNNILNGS